MIADYLRENPECQIGVTNRFGLEDFLAWCLTPKNRFDLLFDGFFESYWERL